MFSRTSANSAWALLLIKLKVEPGSEKLPLNIIEAAGARVLDDCPETYTVELTAAKQQTDDFVERLGTCAEILAVVRSGAMAIARGHNVLTA